MSPVFNISDLTEYHEGGAEEVPTMEQCGIPAPTSEKEEIEAILDSHMGRSTRNRYYEEYLVKWKGRPMEDSSWISQAEVGHLCFPLSHGK